MNYKKFDSDDIVRNHIKTYPDNEFSFYSGSVYMGSLNQISADDIHNHTLYSGTPLNLMGGAGNYLRTYVVNAVNSTVTTLFPNNLSDQEKYNRTTGEYYSFNYFPSSSVSILRVTSSQAESPYISALKNTLEWYSTVSPSYKFNNFSKKDLAIINVPSIFYGSSIKRGSMSLSYYYTGSIISTITDYRSNGELVEIYGPNSGSVAGVVLYEEGIVLLSGSWNLPSSNTTKWNMFGTGSTTAIYNSGSFDLKFKGTNLIPTITMFAHAEKNEFNTSANKTYVDSQDSDYNFVLTGSNVYRENNLTPIKNTIQSNYTSVSGSFKKQTFINQIGIYDSDKNLIAIAKLANPVKKNNDREYTFKLKLDI